MPDDRNPKDELNIEEKLKSPTRNKWYVQFRDDSYVDVISDEEQTYKDHLVHVQWTDGFEDEKITKVTCNGQLDPQKGELVPIEDLEEDDIDWYGGMCANCASFLQKKLDK